MASSSKFLKLEQNILLEWVYDNENLVQENYTVLNNLNLKNRGFISQTPTNFNNINNSAFVVDPILKKYSKVDTLKYNFLKLENYTSSYIQYDKVRIHFPTNFSFIDNNVKGFYLRIYTYDYLNKKTYDLASIIYDDTILGSDKNIILNEEFVYNEQFWGKYLTFDIPAKDAVSKQRTSTVSTNIPLTNSINLNLTKENGLSLTSPIFIEFSYINVKETILGITSYYLSDIFKKSITPIPEYKDLSVTIRESVNGDFFEIFGNYSQSNEQLDDFIDELKSKGRSVNIEYVVSLFEENILVSEQTFLVKENFSKKLLYRPVLTFTNTTASIDIEMKVIDLTDDSIISRFTSISLKNNLFKYGKKLAKIDVSNIFNPKIYNMKSLNNTDISNNTNNITNINITKVNYPVIVNQENILVSSTNSTNDDYKSMGLSEIILSPFNNIIKFQIGVDKNYDNNITPYDLSPLLVNSSLVLIFKSDTEYIEKDIWRETNENDFKTGIVIFKIEENDLKTIFKIGKNNKKYYITVKSTNTNTKTLLYSGTWIDFNSLKFIDTTNSSISQDIEDFADEENKTMTQESQEVINTVPDIIINNNFNAVVFINPDTNVKVFDDYLIENNIFIYLRKPAGNNEALTYMYMILNISDEVFDDIKNQPAVSEIIKIDFCLGKDLTNLQSVNEDISLLNCNNENVTPVEVVKKDITKPVKFLIKNDKNKKLISNHIKPNKISIDKFNRRK